MEDRVLSRRHCVIRNENGQFRLQDLNSSNGTYVNGLPVTAHVLKCGDQIRAGESIFLFLDSPAADVAASLPLELAAGTPIASRTVLLKREDALLLRPGNIAADGRRVRSLETLLKISSSIASIRGLESLERKLLELILEVIPGDRAAILLAGLSPDDFTSVYRFRVVNRQQAMQVSRTIVEQVMRERSRCSAMTCSRMPQSM